MFARSLSFLFHCAAIAAAALVDSVKADQKCRLCVLYRLRRARAWRRCFSFRLARENDGIDSSFASPRYVANTVGERKGEMETAKNTVSALY